MINNIEDEYIPKYIILNQKGEVFSGMKFGQFIFSPDWAKAKPLSYSSTYYLRRIKSYEIIEETKINN